MKIGFCGAGSTGKSTLASLIAEHYELPLIEEGARTIAQEMGIRRHPDWTNMPGIGKEYQDRILMRQVTMENINDDGFVSDRTTLDFVMYWIKDHAHLWDSKTNNEYINACLKRANNYDILVYTPIEFAPTDDGFRKFDPEYQKETDFIMQLLLAKVRKEHSTNIFTVYGDLESRFQWLVPWIDIFAPLYKKSNFLERLRGKEG